MDEKQKKEYWDGNTNKVIRYYFYSQKGLALFNEFRYIFMLIFGIYITLKLSNPIWLVGMFVISLPLLIIAGYISVHYVGKVVDFLNIQYSTHWSRYGYELQEKQNQLLTEIKQEIKESKNDSLVV